LSFGGLAADTRHRWQRMILPSCVSIRPKLQKLATACPWKFAEHKLQTPGIERYPESVFYATLPSAVPSMLHKVLR
jgi:hypothetical protein